MIIAFFGHSNYESNLKDKELILKILNNIRQVLSKVILFALQTVIFLEQV